MKEYKLSAGGKLEIAGSALILLSSILPWVALQGMTGLGNIKSAFVSPINLLLDMNGISALTALGLLVINITNISVKSSHRLRWLSLFAVIFVVLLYLQIIHTDIEGAVFGTVGGNLAFGVFAAFLGVILLIIGMCIPSKFNDTPEAKDIRQESKEYNESDYKSIQQACEDTCKNEENISSQESETVDEKSPLWYKVVYAIIGFAVISEVYYFIFIKNDSENSAPNVEDVVPIDEGKTRVSRPSQYITFEENGKKGVKDGTGKIIIPAEYENLYIDENENGSILATESETGNMMRYFKKTGQMLKHIDFAGGTAVTLFHFADTDTHAFYTDEGQVMASGLSGDIFCLRQVDPQTGYGIRTYYGFRNKDNNDDFMPVYDEDGNRVCTFTINGWQLFGIDHLTRNEDEPRDFEKEFTFTIKLDDFIAAHRSVVH